MAAFNPPVDQQPQSPADYARLLERERLLREISAEIAAADDLDAVLARVCAGVRRLLGADVAEVGLIDAAGETLEIRYSDGRPEGLLPGARPLAHQLHRPGGTCQSPTGRGGRGDRPRDPSSSSRPPC